MKLIGKNIELIAVSINDDELDNLIEDAEELYNMSETRLYPQGLPLKMRFRIETDNKLIGEFNLSRVRWYNKKAELGIILKKDYRKKGYAKEALNLVLEYAFNKMNLHRVEAEVIEYNTASLKLVEKFGFVLEGRLREAKYSGGKYWDILRYGLLKSEFKKKEAGR